MSRAGSVAGLGLLLGMVCSCVSLEERAMRDAQRRAYERQVYRGCTKLETGMDYQSVAALIPMPELPMGFLVKTMAECELLAVETIEVDHPDFHVICRSNTAVVVYHKFGKRYWVRFDKEGQMADWSFGAYQEGAKSCGCRPL